MGVLDPTLANTPGALPLNLLLGVKTFSFWPFLKTPLAPEHGGHEKVWRQDQPLAGANAINRRWHSRKISCIG
jgi:hypothetical protein